MEWTRSETIGLASASCVFCRGLGLRKTPIKEESKPCGCVFRAIFRACFVRYRHCVEKAGVTSCMTLDHAEGPTGHRFWGRRNEEYIADFELVCRRSLNREEFEVFQWHFLQGADWKFCIGKIGIDKGTFFHNVYCLQEKLGRVFRELRPYALFPLDEYFSGIKMRKVSVMQLCGPREIVGGEDEEMEFEEKVEDLTIVAETNVVEMPRCNDKVSRKFPWRRRPIKAA